jgi:hypothetical protein
MADIPFDPSVFTRAPIITIESGITLCKTLVTTCPKGMPDNVKKARQKLKNVADAAQQALAQRQRELGKVTNEDVRRIDVDADNAWSALRMRLEAYASLPEGPYPRAARAGELLTSLFGGDGLKFLQLRYTEQLSTADAVLSRIDSDGLQKDINAIAGSEFLEHIRTTHAAYGKMVKAMLSRENKGDVNLLEHVRGMGRAIVDFATKVCGIVDDDDPSTVATVQKALQPITAHRDAAGRRSVAASSLEDETASGKPDGGKPE